MKRFIFKGIFFCLLALVTTNCTKPNKLKSKNFLEEAKITKGDVFTPETLQINLTGQVIDADTHGNLTSGKLKKAIDLGAGFYTNKIHFYENGDQVVIFFEITDDDGAFNDVYCVDKKTLQTIWKANLWSFNLTVGQSEGEILYLSAGENAYAMEMKTGKILWQADGLYHHYGFNYFDTIAIEGDAILLTGKSYSKEKGDVLKTVTLNKKNGKILAVKPTIEEKA